MSLRSLHLGMFFVLGSCFRELPMEKGVVDSAEVTGDTDTDTDIDIDIDTDDTDTDTNTDSDDTDTDSGDTDDTDTDTAPDNDGDGYSIADGDCDDSDASLNLDDADMDGFTTCANDCNDFDVDINPGAKEVCDGEDNDCDGDIDDDDADLDAATQELWYPDDDGDGFGDDSAPAVKSCDAPSGYVDDATDCDDDDDAFNPDAIEVCDGKDNDCNGDIDEGLQGDYVECPGLDCADILSARPGASDSVYFIDPLEAGAYEAYCDMTTDSGGWTLVAVVSDDGQDTWTWNNRTYWESDTTTFGDLEELEEDYKSDALHEMGFSDMLFIHNPSGEWGAYHSVGDDTQDLGSFISGFGDSYCWATETGGVGYALSDGTLSSTGDLCSTDLFFNAKDQEGSSSSCVGGSTNSADAHGPMWSGDRNDGCPMDDPGRTSSLGPRKNDSSTEQEAVGYGDVLNLNTGTSGAAENYMHVFVR